MRELRRHLGVQLTNLATLCTIGAALLVTAGSRPERGALVPVGRIAHPELNECSGLVHLDGAFWANNDSGDSARIFRSERLDFSDAEVLPVPGAIAVDWEEITVAGDDILICDIGDNARFRDDLLLYRVRYVPGTEIAPGRLERVATYPIRYPDGRHDAEAAATIDGKLHIVTKARDDSVTNVYRFDTLRDEEELAGGKNVPVLVGALDIGAGEQVTAATYDATNETLILLTYAAILRYPRDRLSGPPASVTRILARQCEAMCLDGEDLVFTNEQRDIFRLERFARRRVEEALPPRASAKLPAIAAGGRAGREAEIAIDGTGGSWRDESAEVPLRGALPGEELRWVLAGDRLLLHGRFRMLVDVLPTEAESPELGSGVLLLFGRDRRRFVAEDDLQLAVTIGVDGEVDVWRAHYRGEDASFEPAPFCAVKGQGREGTFEFELAVETKAIFGGRLPDRFLFDIQGNILHGETEPRFSGLDVYSGLRPYAWGEVTVAR